MTTCRIKSKFRRDRAGHQWRVIVASPCQIHLLVIQGKIQYNGHRPLIVKRAVIGSKGGWKLSTIFLSCEMFHDWSIIKLGNILYLLDGISLLYFLKQHLTAFVDSVYWCGLEKRTLHSGIFFSVEFSSHVGCPPSGAKKW